VSGHEPVAAGAASQSEGFFRELPELSEFSHAAELEKYADAPSSWHVVITDVRGSTRAIEAGRYRDVNALGVSSIVAVQNALSDLEVPYVFGGDGATLLVPGSRLARVEAALRGVRRMAETAFELELRAATVSVGELERAGERVRVARLRVSPAICLAVFAGGGFACAERWVKDPSAGERFAVPAHGDESADLEGFECRWRPVESRFGSVISLLVFALSPSDAEREATYKRAIAAIERVLAGRDARPVRLEGLRMLGIFGDFSTEARVRTGTARGARFDAASAHARKQSLVGRALMMLKQSAGGFDGERYRAELVENTDFRKFDETLRMVLDVSDRELEELVSHLAREHQQGHLVYGLHRSKSALMTCFVRAYRGNHVHFVDGNDGGYALAAKALKAQLAASVRRTSEHSRG